MSGASFYAEAIISLLVIVDPISRGFFFRVLTEHEPERRREYVARIMTTVAIVLGVSAVAGREILNLLGINLGAFGIAGGVVLALMGFEMLFGGEPSRTQGGKEAHEEPAPLSAEDSILVPYAIPFMAGPGAITTVITLAASGKSGVSGVLAAVIAVAVVVAMIPVGHLYIANRVKLSQQAISVVTKFGGLIIATIGVQLMLNGIKIFFQL
jgi:multiple antibiotic resistance protein